MGRHTPVDTRGPIYTNQIFWYNISEARLVMVHKGLVVIFQKQKEVTQHIAPVLTQICSSTPRLPPRPLPTAFYRTTTTTTTITTNNNNNSVAKVVAPKRAALKAAEGKLKTAMDSLNAKRAKLAEVQKKLENLQTEFTQTINKKKRLEAEVQQCELKLQRYCKFL